MSESPLDDYEWKLIPREGATPVVAEDAGYEGLYYVLRFDTSRGRFVFQHDTWHFGHYGLHWGVETYSEFGLPPAQAGEHETTRAHPPTGWLRDHVQCLIG